LARRPVLHAPFSSALYCPAPGRRGWTALRASLRDGFASLDLAPSRQV